MRSISERKPEEEAAARMPAPDIAGGRQLAALLDDGPGGGRQRQIDRLVVNRRHAAREHDRAQCRANESAWAPHAASDPRSIWTKIPVPVRPEDPGRQFLGLFCGAGARELPSPDS